MEIKKGDFIIIDTETVDELGTKGSKKEKKESGSMAPQEAMTRGKHQQVKMSQNKEAPPYKRNFGKGRGAVSRKDHRSRSSLGKGGPKKTISTKWELLKQSAIASGAGKLNTKARELLKKMLTKKARVNWKREFRKFFDQAFRNYEYRLPNKRTLASGKITYGIRRSGTGTLKRLVLAVDTSGSITTKMIDVFFEEVWKLGTLFDIDETIILYVSDTLHKNSIDIVKKGRKPDLNKIASTGGNAEGFHPPFKWLQQQKIIPSAFIYFTDTHAEFPNVNQYNISKYKDKVFWFIANLYGYNEPPFGRSIVVKMNSDGKIE